MTEFLRFVASALGVSLRVTVSAIALFAIAGSSAAHGQSLADRLKAVQSGHEGPGIKAKLPPWKPASSSVSKQEIPLVQGLTVVTAVNDSAGDYESIKIHAGGLRGQSVLSYSADNPVPKGEKPKTCEWDTGHRWGRPEERSRVQRILREPIGALPGTTAISTSTEVLNQLRAGNSVQFQFGAPSCRVYGHTDRHARRRQEHLDKQERSVDVYVHLEAGRVERLRGTRDGERCTRGTSGAARKVLSLRR